MSVLPRTSTLSTMYSAPRSTCHQTASPSAVLVRSELSAIPFTAFPAHLHCPDELTPLLQSSCLLFEQNVLIWVAVLPKAKFPEADKSLQQRFQKCLLILTLLVNPHFFQTEYKTEPSFTSVDSHSSGRPSLSALYDQFIYIWLFLLIKAQIPCGRIRVTRC